MEHLLHIDQVVHDLGLANISRDAVEHQDVDVGLERVRVYGRIDLRFPKLDGYFIRHELALARILEEGGADLRPSIDRPKHISAGAVKKARDASEGVALGAFAAARGAEKEI